MHGELNEKIDVYAFGVVLLELLSGKKAIDNGLPKGQESLVVWVSIYFQHELILCISVFQGRMNRSRFISFSRIYPFKHKGFTVNVSFTKITGKTHSEGRENLRTARSQFGGCLRPQSI